MVADVGHAQWVFTVPKMLRPYFMHHRELLGPLCTAAWETVDFVARILAHINRLSTQGRAPPAGAVPVSL